MQSHSAGGDLFCLDWPEEQVGGDNHFSRWFQPGSNCCLDFHGDPLNAQLVVFSDGNHHMALKDCLDLFSSQNKGLSGIFYATTPPGPLVNMLRTGGVHMGNLTIRVSPHLFISPPHVLDQLVAEGYMQTHTPFMRNRGSVLLVKKGNPKNISGVADLVEKNLRLFLSNPKTEKVSYRGYVDTLKEMAHRAGIEPSFFADAIETKIVYGQCIHHREAPQALADDRVDVAIVYYHLALRYVRIFPALFEMVPLGGTVLDPRPVSEICIGKTHAGIVGDGGSWGEKFFQFLFSQAASDIYAHHGLLRAN
jgi:hypothetical protein